MSSALAPRSPNRYRRKGTGATTVLVECVSVAQRTPVVTALGRPPFVAALGVVTLLLVVWAAAVPRPERVIPGLRAGIEVEQQAPAEGLTVYDPESGAKRVPGPWEQTSDTIAALLGWAAVLVLVLGATVCLYLLVRALAKARRFVP